MKLDLGGYGANHQFKSLGPRVLYALWHSRVGGLPTFNVLRRSAEYEARRGR